MAIRDIPWSGTQSTDVVKLGHVDLLSFSMAIGTEFVAYVFA